MNEQQERAAFEEWSSASSRGGDLRWFNGDGGRYLNLFTEEAWQGWKARAVIAAAGVKTVDGGQEQ